MTDINKTFEVEMVEAGRWRNFFSGSIFIIYTLLSSDLIQKISARDAYIFLAIVTVLALLSQFIITPYTNRILTKDISERLAKNNEGLLSIDERTDLLRDVMTCPKSICLEVCFIALGTTLIPVLLLIFQFQISIYEVIYIIICCMCGYYFIGLQVFLYAENLCSEKATKIISMGINTETVHKYKFFGLSTKERSIYFNIIPIVIGAILQISIVVMSVCDGWNSIRIISHVLFVLTANAIVILLTAYHIQKSISNNSRQITAALESLTDTEAKTLYLPSDLNSELSYNIFLIDELINYLRDISTETISTGNEIAESSFALSEDANHTAETSISEAAAIRECLATMENAKNQHKRISSHINLIQDSALVTKNSADASSELLTSGIRKMSEITQANLDTIYGIKDLSEKVDTICNIVDSIDAVAERTKTIAFNAELEASVAGDKGEKFHIVSNEILRLASSIKSSVIEIRQQITDILHSCDNLIISSESGTQKTREGSEFYTKLETRFKELCLSSDITAESLRKIVDITDVQQTAFEQINTTLSEINSGFEKFSLVSQKISSETKLLRETAATLRFSSSKKGGKNS